MYLFISINDTFKQNPTIFFSKNVCMHALKSLALHSGARKDNVICKLNKEQGRRNEQLMNLVQTALIMFLGKELYDSMVHTLYFDTSQHFLNFTFLMD